DVGDAVSGDRVGAGVSGERLVGAAGHHGFLDVRRHRPVRAHHGGVGTGATAQGRLVYHVVGVVDYVGVVAGAAHHDVAARSAVDEIGAVEPLNAVVSAQSHEQV